jgi:hypothetical protein
MNAVVFHTLMKNSSALRVEEVNELREWSNQYPYSQVIHVLIARGTRDHQTTDAPGMLNRAAVYSGDRSVVKAVMTAQVKDRIVVPVIKEAEVAVPSVIKPIPSPPEQTETSATADVKKENVVASTPSITVEAASSLQKPVTLEGDELRKDLASELHRLQHLMSAFDASYEQLKNTNAPSPPAKPTSKPGAGKPPAPVTPADSTEAPLIEEIKSSKRKPKLVSPKVAEQGEIIDHFIKVAPTLPRTKPSEPSADLAAESVNYGDHIVSETLVEILLKQGKKAKAIEMLKKLIWKFPQKKAYFAAQIEALKS